MASRSGRRARCGAAALAALLAWPAAPSGQATPEHRVAERLRALQQEAAQLEGREKTLLTELRKLEIERQLRTDELARVEEELRATESQLADAIARAAALRERADDERPDVEARLVRLYKMGRAGYWRLLLDVDDLQAVGRAYRTAAVLTRLDAERIREHQRTLAALAQERQALEARARHIGRLQERAATARAAADRAVASRAALLSTVTARRELAVQLAAELDAAQQKLQAALVQGARASAPAVPIRPFRGDLPWPADGIVLSRFGRQRTAGGVQVTRHGIELSLAEGRPVAAVHDGAVTFAGPFTGYGQLVILDHGEGTHSLYGHLGSVAVKQGERVAAGGRIGLSGRNPGGNPALYFELRVDGKPVDPLQWLRKP